jgi:hypothetical protein
MNSMGIIFTIARLESKVLFRERVFFLLLIIFVLMSLLSSGIGLLATRTTTSIYDASVQFLQQTGVRDIPANPLASLPALTNFRNVIIYMFLVGSLVRGERVCKYNRLMEIERKCFSKTS